MKIEKMEEAEREREERHTEYVKWHIRRYGRPPNPNFFRDVSDSDNSRSRSRSITPRTANRSNKEKAQPGGLAAIKLQNQRNQ